MEKTQERATSDVRDSGTGIDETTAAVEGATTSPVEQTTGAVGALVGMLTGGFVIAAAAGFVVGVVFGVAIGRHGNPPPPRWQVWH
jgi:hypothetical protein